MVDFRRRNSYFSFALLRRSGPAFDKQSFMKFAKIRSLCGNEIGWIFRIERPCQTACEFRRNCSPGPVSPKPESPGTARSLIPKQRKKIGSRDFRNSLPWNMRKKRSGLITNLFREICVDKTRPAVTVNRYDFKFAETAVPESFERLKQSGIPPVWRGLLSLRDPQDFFTCATQF